MGLLDDGVDGSIVDYSWVAVVSVRVKCADQCRGSKLEPNKRSFSRAPDVIPLLDVSRPRPTILVISTFCLLPSPLPQRVVTHSVAEDQNLVLYAPKSHTCAVCASV